MDIGGKIRKSRTEAGLTQEQVAEAIGISRQTVSNWENERSYPDIVSVLKMSDLYGVSLDYLLKEGSAMNDYMNYIDENTNVVKSKAKLSKLLLILSYLVIWAAAIIVFWLVMPGHIGYAPIYSVIFLWVILPVTTFVISILIGKNDFWGKCKWFAPIAFGCMYMLAEYATFRMANNIATEKINAPDLSMLFIGVIISLIGMGIGHLVFLIKKRTK